MPKKAVAKALPKEAVAKASAPFDAQSLQFVRQNEEK
jgi:hypothetical protein